MHWKSPMVRIALVLLLGGVIGAGVVTWREHERGQRIQQEIDTLRREADKIRRENQGLAQKIMYFASPDFQEREAKDKLGFRRQEEDAVILQGTPSIVNPEDEQTADAAPKEVLPELPNYRKWWNKFF